VLDVAIKTLEQGGIASRIESYQFLPPIDAWSFPKYPGKTVILPPNVDLAEEIKKFIIAHESYLKEADCWLGTWINPQTKHYYLDLITSRRELEEARKVAIETSLREGRKIVALYNSGRDQIVYLWDEIWE
jgi:hypothetical protein